jgi:hypothetical protein
MRSARRSIREAVPQTPEIDEKTNGINKYWILRKECMKVLSRMSWRLLKKQA